MKSNIHSPFFVFAHFCTSAFLHFRLCSFVPLCLCAFASFGQGKPITVNKVVAKVDNYYVLLSDLEESIAQYKQNGQNPAPCQVLEGLVVNKMLLAKAEIDSITVEDKVVDGELNGRMEVMAKRFGSEKNIIEAYGKNTETLKAEMRQMIHDQKVTEKMQGKITEAVKATPSEIKRFFNAIPKDSLPYIPAEVEIGHIVRFAKVTKAQKDELRTRLLSYRERIEKGGESFTGLASAYSEDVASAKEGGDLGFAKRGAMVPQFEEASLKLKPNEISDVVESDFGLHLIQLLETRGAEYHSRHILLRPDYNRMDLSEPKRILDSLKALIVIDSLKFEKAAKDWSEDKNTADGGGLIKDYQTGSTKQSLDASMDFAMYSMLDTMKVGMVSEPLQYRTEEGKTAMRILYYKSRIEPHYANLKDDFEKMTNLVLGNKRTKAVDLWFKKAIADVFIDIAPEYRSCKIFGITDSSEN